VGAWRTPHPQWGNWRLPNATARQESGCFSVALRSNSAGARDRERGRDGEGRILMLGDSFLEGWGVEEDQRVSNLLEQRLGREVLNFGAATHGPLQYQLVYEQLASGFAHDHVVVLLLADNDFTDNDMEFWKSKTASGNRYRPYYEADGSGGYRIVYPQARARPDAAEAPREVGVVEGIGRAIRRNSWALRTGEYVGELMSGRLSYAGYFDYTDRQLDAVEWSLRRIRAQAGNRKMTVVLIPRLNDFTRTAAKGTSPLIARLEAFGVSNNMRVVDLLPPLRAAAPDLAALFLACDGHWSLAGNKAVADALVAALAGR
jgi:hypothetical protein